MKDKLKMVQENQKLKTMGADFWFDSYWSPLFEKVCSCRSLISFFPFFSSKFILFQYNNTTLQSALKGYSFCRSLKDTGLVVEVSCLVDASLRYRSSAYGGERHFMRMSLADNRTSLLYEGERSRTASRMTFPLAFVLLSVIFLSRKQEPQR
jgi:hypothetical protein